MSKTKALPLLLLVSAASFAQTFRVYDLRCDQMTKPIGVDNPSPAFSWKLYSDLRNTAQAEYEITVALDSLFSDPVWTSGPVASDKSIMAMYDGEPLQDATKYWWKVKASDNHGNSATSHAASFITGVSDWGNAKWIAYEIDKETLAPYIHFPDAGQLGGKKVGDYKLPVFRKTAALKKPVKSATAYVCGLGHFDFFINGQKAGDHFLDPGWTKYDKEALYCAFDVTDMLQQGKNALGIMLGNGFYNIPNERYFKITGSMGAPKALALVRVVFEDGATEDIVTDATWKTTDGPITYSSIYGGEDYDAAKLPADWLAPEYNDKNWKNAIIAKSDIALKSQASYPLRVRQELPVVTSNGKLYDFGQNASGIVKIKVKGPKGSKIKIIPGELLNPDSTVNQSASGEPYEWNYTLAGNENGETWQPQFTYYGFRYANVEADPEVEVQEITALHTCYDAPEAGQFNCSKPIFNKTHELIDWAMRSNMASVLTDCPHREKLGWLEQVYLMQPSLQYRYDLQRLYHKMAADMSASLTESDVVPTIAPEYVRFAAGFEDTPEWGSAFIISLWNIYKWYGDDELLRKYYPEMKKYVGYLDSRADNGIVAYGLGDWFDIGPNAPGYAQLTSNGVTATATYYYDCQIMAQIASLLGLAADKEMYEQKAKYIKEAFHNKYYCPETQTYDRDSQTTNAVVLVMGLCPDSLRQTVIENLQRDIKGRGNALTAGDIGYTYLLQALEQNGLQETIYDMNTRYDVPGYGWQLAHGATALTESWQAYGFVSNNHFMLGHLMAWLYSGLAGLSQADGSAAFKTLKFDPQPVGDVNHASASYATPYGAARIDWEKKDDSFLMHVSVPANSDAEVWLPANSIEDITEYDAPIDPNSVIGTSYGKICVKVGSGEYRFECKN